MNKNLSCKSKNIICIIKCENCKQTHIGWIKNFSNRISLHKSNIKREINRKLFVSKHIFECSHGSFKTMPIFQTDNYNLYCKLKKKILLKNTNLH